jgi:uncharacterized protein with gpF-like domain
MSHAKIKLKSRAEKQADAGMIKGEVLAIPVMVGERLNTELQKHIDKMIRETLRAVKELFSSDDYLGIAMDENIGIRARVVTNQLTERFKQLFVKVSAPAVNKMIDSTDKASANSLKSSLSDKFSIKTDIMTPVLREQIAAGAAGAASLIKRIPEDYLGSVGGEVFRAITQGKGLPDIKADLDKYGVKVKNWAHNVALDQTRKTYKTLNAARMQAVGIEEFMWRHSGGSNHPNLYHKNVLHGQIFKFADMPIIDKKTGTRGLPGDWYFCRCTMRAIVRMEA